MDKFKKMKLMNGGEKLTLHMKEKNEFWGTSLVVQWLRLQLLM